MARTQLVQSDTRFPYVASIDFDTERCGAVLISKRFVLTTTFCVGSSDSLEINGVDYPCKSVTSHPGFDVNTFENDIAVYELESDVPDSLPYIRLKPNPIGVTAKTLTTLGFGETTGTAILETHSHHLTLSECNKEVGFADAIFPSMLCAIAEDGRDACSAFEGMPLILKGSNWYGDDLVGLVSFVNYCGDAPVVYTSISHHYDWIVETMCAMNPEAVPDYVTCSGEEDGEGEERTVQDDPDQHRWRPPRVFGDQRSPCPFLNTLANHGFINRNGTNIDIHDMADQLEAVYNVDAKFLLEGPIQLAIDCDQTYEDENGVTRIDLDVLFDGNCEEHEASMVRADSFFGLEASKTVDDTLLNNLMRRNPGENFLTFDNVLDYQAERIKTSRLTNPETKFRDFDLETMGAQAMFLFLLGSDETLLTVEKARLYLFLLEEKLPDDFVPGALRDTAFDPSNPSDFVHERHAEAMANVERFMKARLGQ